MAMRNSKQESTKTNEQNTEANCQHIKKRREKKC